MVTEGRSTRKESLTGAEVDEKKGTEEVKSGIELDKALLSERVTREGAVERENNVVQRAESPWDV